jgi:hypothetical protein
MVMVVVASEVSLRTCPETSRKLQLCLITRGSVIVEVNADP